MSVRQSLIVAVLAAVVLFTPSSAVASGTAPSAPQARISNTTQTTISLSLVKPSCDADGDFGYQSSTLFWGYYDFQLNGQPYAAMQIYTLDPGAFNCGTYFAQQPAQQYSGLHCNTSYTVRVRGVDLANHKGPFVSFGGSAGAKTAAC
jgi:hypothetical protein